MRSDRFILCGGLLLLIAMAWLSEGFFHWDEHYQLLEFAQYKSGYAVKEGLAWEFNAKIRPGLQPFIAYLVFGFLRFIHLSDPFFMAFALRLITALISFGVVIALSNYIFFQSNPNKAKLTFLALVFFLWFGAFLQVRFSSENWAGLSFIGGFLLMQPVQPNRKKKLLNTVGCGLLLSLAFQLRYQMAFSIAGLLLWIFWYTKPTLKLCGQIGLGLLIGVCIGIIADHWLYGTWQLTPYYYFTKNIVDGKAASFGIEPWWYYFTLLYQNMGPGINILLLGTGVYSLVRFRQHALVWALLPFLLAHMLIGHKEMRFLFPLYLPFIALISLGIQDLLGYIPRKNWLLLFFIPILLLNVSLLFERLTSPASVRMPYYKFMLAQAKKQQRITMYFSSVNGNNNNMYGPSFLRMTLYRPKNLVQIPISNLSLIGNDNNSTSRYYFTIVPLSQQDASNILQLVFKLKYWDISTFDYTQWPAKSSHFWSIYSIRN